jgi:SAM-dependent methyltransferase
MCGSIRLRARLTDEDGMQNRRTYYGKAEYWDEQATSFDDEPDHGLANDRVRAAWSRRLTAWLPELPSAVVDLGCGTGSLSVLVADVGHDVVGVDLSPVMVERAQRKAAIANLPTRFVVGDIASPDLARDTIRRGVGTACHLGTARP